MRHWLTSMHLRSLPFRWRLHTPGTSMLAWPPRMSRYLSCRGSTTMAPAICTHDVQEAEADHGQRHKHSALRASRGCPPIRAAGTSTAATAASRGRAPAAPTSCAAEASPSPRAPPWRSRATTTAAAPRVELSARRTTPIAHSRPVCVSTSGPSPFHHSDTHSRCPHCTCPGSRRAQVWPQHDRRRRQLVHVQLVLQLALACVRQALVARAEPALLTRGAAPRSAAQLRARGGYRETAQTPQSSASAAAVAAPAGSPSFT